MRLFRKSRRSKKVKDASQVASVVTHSDRRGAHGRAVRTPWIDGQLGMKLSQSTLHMTPSTSKQMAGLALAEAAPPTGNHGILLGVDVTTGSAVVHDPFVAYREESGFSSPNGVIFGDLGFGKSQLAKAWIIRNLAFGRRVIAVDKKRQEYTDGRQPEGEYSAVARALGYTPVTLRTGGGGVKINILDPRIAGHTSDGVAGQQMLLEAVISAAMDRDLTEVERKAVALARRTAVHRAQVAGEIAHVGHVVTALLDPDEEIACSTPGVGSSQQLVEFGRDCGFALDRLVSEELAGLIDGPTDQSLDLVGQFTSFDISSLPEEGRAVPILMTVINTWVRSVLVGSGTPVPTLLLIDEAWHLVDGAYASIARRNAKIARGIALSNISIFQHPTDIPAGSPAAAMIKEAQTIIVFRQGKADDAAGVCELFGWDPNLKDVLMTLDQGVALLQIGSTPPVVCSMTMSDFELEVGDTNQAMLSTASVSSTRAHPGEVRYGNQQGTDR